MLQRGVFGVVDSGIPETANHADYHTIVLLHGYGYNSGIFEHMLSMARVSRIRLVLLNRRGYPGALPFDAAEAPPATLELQVEFMKQRALELHEFLETFIMAETISAAGAITLAGWSFGGCFIMALLAFAHLFPIKSTTGVVSYIRRTVLYDPPYHTLGYAPPPDSYNPLHHPSVPDINRARIFSSWVSGYYTHAADLSKLEFRTPQLNPPPTLETMSEEEISHVLTFPPILPNGSDQQLGALGIDAGLYEFLRNRTLYLTKFAIAIPAVAETVEDWDKVKLRYIWCEKSVWEMPWGMVNFQRDLEEARKSGKETRKVQIMKFSGANHFAHWDIPESVLSILSDEEK